METITSLEALQQLYGQPSSKSLEKVAHKITPHYRTWIEASRFVVLTTVGPDGTDGSPRGDTDPVVRIADDTTLMLPDWRGNNRLDSLRNIVTDGRVSLMFMVPGSTTVIRVNGTAVLTADESVTATFEKQGKRPKTVIVITIQALYFQCAKALMRSELWTSADQSAGLPSAGDFLQEMIEDVDAHAYDTGYADYAKPRMW